MTALNAAILFNNSTGSNTQSSGSSASANVYGSGASTTSGSAVVTGIVTTGVQTGDLLWVQSSSGRQFSVIASVDSGTQVTCDDTFANTESSRTWAIGGKRATFDNADSRQAFADSNGWVFETETDQSLTSQIAGPPLAGTHEFRGSAGSVKTITQTQNDRHFVQNTNNNAILVFSNLKFDNSSVTKTVAYALDLRRQFACFGCVFGDPTNQLNVGLARAADFPTGIVANCIFQNCTNTTAGMYLTFSSGVKIDRCVFRNNVGSGLYTAQYPMWVTNSIFHDNGNDGWTKSIPVTRQGFAEGNIFYNNTRDGLANISSKGFTGLVSNVSNNLFISNGRYGWSLGSSESNVPASRNVFYNNASGDVSGNTALSYGDNITLAADPFVDSAAADFNIADNTAGNTLRANNFSINTDTAVYPFRQYVSDAFGAGGGGAVLHPLRSN